MGCHTRRVVSPQRAATRGAHVRGRLIPPMHAGDSFPPSTRATPSPQVPGQLLLPKYPGNLFSPSTWATPSPQVPGESLLPKYRATPSPQVRGRLLPLMHRATSSPGTLSVTHSSTFLHPLVCSPIPHPRESHAMRVNASREDECKLRTKQSTAVPGRTAAA